MTADAQDLEQQADSAKRAQTALALASGSARDAALVGIARQIAVSSGEILAENERDLAELGSASPALADRLRLTEQRIDDMSQGLAQLAALPDPLARTLSNWRTASGLTIDKVAVPIGLVGIIYEARPNVTADAAAICVKTGNAALLKGSRSALHSNRALVAAIKRGLEAAGLPPACVELVSGTSRESVLKMLKLNRYLDAIIPRGGQDLIDWVVQNASVPVIETGAGNCHVYIDESADPEMAVNITVNAKTQRPAVCNAAETVLVHEEWARRNLARLASALREKGVEIRACPRSRELVPDASAAEEADWRTEYLDLIIAMKIVGGVDEAIEHINRYGTRHSEAIISANDESVRRFLAGVDAAALYHNASTRFTDGFQFGFGAEIGISTQKLHARGPMGLAEMTTYKYIVRGDGQVRNR